MTKKKMIKVNSNDKESILIANFEEIVENVVTFSTNKDFIEFPGIVIFKKEGSSNFLTKILNPGIEIIEIKSDIYDNMKNIVESIILDKSKIVITSKLKPIKTHVINIKKLKEVAIFVKSTEDSILINDYIFTNNEAEFHGDGMFTSKKVYFLSLEDINKIKDLFEEAN